MHFFQVTISLNLSPFRRKSCISIPQKIMHINFSYMNFLLAALTWVVSKTMHILANYHHSLCYKDMLHVDIYLKDRSMLAYECHLLSPHSANTHSKIKMKKKEESRILGCLLVYLDRCFWFFIWKSVLTWHKGEKCNSVVEKCYLVRSTFEKMISMEYTLKNAYGCRADS